VTLAQAVVTRLLVGLAWLVTGVRAQWRGCAPQARQRLYFANHSSHLDALVIWAALPSPLRGVTRPVAASDYWGRTRLRRWLAQEVLSAVLIDRAAGRSALTAMGQALAQGASLILFPEGTRGDGTAVGPLQPGLYLLAKRFPEVELIPVYLQNLSRILPKGEVLPVPILGSAVFGAPLARLSGERREAFLVRARAALDQTRDNVWS
jgi:1-acyl-sn-glycerol-3-phosphate acyltransferase